MQVPKKCNPASYETRGKLISAPNENSQKASKSVNVLADPDWVSNGKQAARKMFPRRSQDQKSTPVNVSTYSTQRRDKEKKMKMRTTYPAAQHDKDTNDMTRKPRRTQKCNDRLAQLRGERANFIGLDLGCIEANFCKYVQYKLSF